MTRGMLHVRPPRRYATRFGKAMLVETWERLLCLLVGIADYLLTPKEGESQLGDGLANQLLRVLLSTWLRSKTREGWLWDTLEQRTRLWVHRLPTIQQVGCRASRVAGQARC